MKQSATDSANPRRKRWQLIFLLAACAVMGYGAYQHFTPPPRSKIVPASLQLSKSQEDSIREYARRYGRMVLGITPAQEKQLEAIWDTPPSSLEDLVEREKLTDKILTEEQRRQVVVVRTIVRGMVIDMMFEPARKRFKPEEFDDFKNQIKLRVNQRFTTARNR